MPTLDVLASNISPTPYLICPILDARKGELYAALYRWEEGNSLKKISVDQAISPENLVQKTEERTIFLGSGVKTYGDYLRKTLAGLAAFVSASLNLPHGSTVARLGLKQLQKNEVLDLSTFTPIYIRASEAEIKWKEKYSGHV